MYVCLKRDRLCRDFLIDKACELLHDIPLDLFEEPIEVSLVGLSEPVSVGQDLLGESLSLLGKVSFELFESPI